MNRSFRESYLGYCYKPLRGWHAGKMRESLRKTRRNLARFYDEEGLAALPKERGLHKKLRYAGGCRKKPDWRYAIMRRNGRKFMRLLAREEDG